MAAKENAKPNGDVVVSEKAEEKEKEAKDEKKEVTPEEKKNGDTKTTPKKVEVEVEITGEVQKVYNFSICQFPILFYIDYLSVLFGRVPSSAKAMEQISMKAHQPKLQ